MFRLIPREMKFFELFAELSASLTEGAKLLRSILQNPTDLGMQAEQMQAIEHRGDKATHAIITKLNQTFITPFDREDIHRLASSLDDVLDFMNAAAERIWMYKITEPPPAAAKLSKLVLSQCKELGEAVSHLKDNGDVLARCVEIKRLENEADVASREAIGSLFEREKDPITLIKIKELLEVLETASDKAED